MGQAIDKNAEQFGVDRFPKLDRSLADVDKQKMSSEGFYSPPAYDSTVVVTVKIIWDDDLWAYYNNMVGHVANPYTEVTPWLISILEDGDDPFESTFDIDYQASLFAYWSNSPPDCGGLVQLFNIGKQSFSKSGCDVRVFMTAIDFGNEWGYSELPDNDGGDDFIMRVDTDGVIPRANLWQHEASHNYGSDDHLWGENNYCIMSYTWAHLYRNWCDSCGPPIAYNRMKFA
jgi:hypothetical protein